MYLEGGRALSTDGRSHQGSDPAPAATTAVSDGHALSDDGRSHPGSDPAPAVTAGGSAVATNRGNSTKTPSPRMDLAERPTDLRRRD